MLIILQYLPYIFLPVLLAIPTGKYIGHIINEEKTFADRFLSPIEKIIYKVFHVSNKEMNWKMYLATVLTFSFVSFVVLFLILKFQNLLPGNPEKFSGLSWSLAFNTAVSFVTNTNWQSYSGEMALSNFSQSMGLTVQNFVSAAVGIAVVFVVIRGIKGVSGTGLGNFWKDMTRILLYILAPISIVIALILVASGVPQTGSGYKTANLIQPAAVDKNNQIIYGADIDLNDKTVKLNGEKVDDAKIITKETLPLFPQASQVAIKQLGTNGGGVLGANSAHPYENPTPLTNFIETVAMIWLPMSLCFAFGESLKKRKQGWAIFTTMGILLVLSIVVEGIVEQHGTTLSHIGNLAMEGKETRIGIVGSAIWSVVTTATSTGSVNAALDSFSSLGGLIPMALMQLGEVVFGGVGSGLYGMLGFIILTVFIAGLMVGRTPEYLGKKIGPFEMKMAVIACLSTPVAILITSAISAMFKSTVVSISNTGAHGFSEFLYAFSSAGANNGSSFGGFNANTDLLNVLLAVAMVISRFLPIMAMIAIAGHLLNSKKVASTSGTLTTTSPTFIFMLIVVILVVGVLSFFPALALGPIADFLTH
ncbi:potassium-transporting ATPase potassium-binding subunit [Leuconostoc citreum]|uniref:potassium-transporting ATPase subunit KdpA n=1 Tax=Leuconostoc citreum TaxID=33964 RepID=UPI001171FA08|nr:potassium-transporting ATPase subunit KdpA [Leuconostoc citreum]GEK60993.1 potassium-transporting ATPase potassium-binding subunit [Leuconostoc citreum]